MIRAGKIDTVHADYSAEVIFDCIAFSNTLGGYIHIGYENGCVIGVEDPASIEESIRTALCELVFPNDLRTLAKISRDDIDGKIVLKIHIPAMPMTLHYIESMGLEYGVYIREGAKTVLATPMQTAQLLDRTCHLQEDTPFLLRHSSHFQISFSALEQYCKHHGCSTALESLLKKGCSLLCKDERITNMGYLFSDSCPSQIQLYDENTDPKRTKYHECSGPYFHQILGAKQQLSALNPFRKEQTYALPYDYPPIAVTALLYHAVRYRDYSLPGEIVFRIKKDQMEVSYPGTLVFPFGLEDYLNGASYPKDPEISKTLDALGLEILHYTNFGTIMEIYSTYGVQPQYSISDHIIRVTLPNLNRFSTVEAYPQLSAKERAVLDLVYLQYCVTRNDVEEELAIPQATAIRTLNSLVKKNFIEKIGSGKNTLYRHLPPSTDHH